MKLQIVKYGHPVLRQKGVPIKTITPEVTRLIEDMFETMYDANGVGLAAQQVAHALQLTVIDVTGITDRPSTLQVAGKEVPVETLMPLVLINPQVKPLGSMVAGPEGCLSFPEIYADVPRAEKIDVKALNAKGEPIQFRCSGLLARAIQHENDHLNGILFIDRMDKETKLSVRPEVEALMEKTQNAK